MEALQGKNSKLLDFIYEVYNQIGYRLPGSEEEKLTSQYLKSYWYKHATELQEEYFKCHPRSLQYFLNSLFIIFSLALFTYLLNPLKAMFLILFALVNLILFRFYNLRFLESFLKKHQSRNLLAKLKPDGETEQVVLIAANLDSPFIARFYDYHIFNYPSLVIRLMQLLFFIFLLTTLLKVFAFLPSLTDYLYAFTTSVGILIIIFQNLFIYFDRSFGSGNNVSGLVIQTEMLRYFAKKKLQKTELWFTAFGASANLPVGASAFIKKHRAELKNLKLKVIHLNDLSKQQLYLTSKETDTYTGHSTEMINLVNTQAKKLKIYCRLGSRETISIATPFLWEGIPAVTIGSGSNHDFWHIDLQEDLPQFIKEENLQTAYKLCRSVVKFMDE